VTYSGGEAPQLSGIAPFDGVAVLNANQPITGTMSPGVFPGPMMATRTGQPSTEVLRQQAAAVIQRCYRWLETVVPAAPQVSFLVTAMITAVQQYEAQQYAACLNQAVAVAETIRHLQSAVPGLPAL
jgi:hypothetical protein